LAEILKIELELSKSGQISTSSMNLIRKEDSAHKFRENLISALTDMFDESSITQMTDVLIKFNIDQKLIEINLENYDVQCESDKNLEQIVTTVVNQIKILS
jgi:hypothetical protein